MEGYDLSKFYMDATDKRGHSKSVRFSMPPDQMYRLQKLVNMEQVPYGTTQDFLRDAIVHRLHWIEQNIPELPKNATVFTRAAEVAHSLATLEASQKLVSDYREQAVHAQGLEREKLVAEIRQDIDRARELELWDNAVDQLKDLVNRIAFGAVG